MWADALVERGGKQQSEEINLDSPIRETGGWGGGDMDWSLTDTYFSPVYSGHS